MLKAAFDFVISFLALLVHNFFPLSFFQLGTSLPKHVPGVRVLGAFVTAFVLRVLLSVELSILAVPYGIAGNPS